jgi:soluble lytic murein transglycosylase-like protein
MNALLMLVLPLAGLIFVPAVEQALNLAQNREWHAAAEALDRAYAEDPVLFGANNLHYLRGRVAEAQNDWGRAVEEFGRVSGKNPLRPLAAWRGAMAAAKIGAFEHAALLVGELPADFPADMKAQLARHVPEPLALRLYSGLTTRAARMDRAALLGDTAALWALLRENKGDDVALRTARLLTDSASRSAEWLVLGETFTAQRQFPEAITAYQRVTPDAVHSAQAQYQLARIEFLKQNYRAAIEGFRAVADAFPDTDWQKDAESWIANTYWRDRQYPEAEKAYLDYIQKYGVKGVQENAVRDLADVYRSLGENTKALALIDRTLTRKLTTAGRQVLLFTKAKILFAEKKYSAALPIFRQLAKGGLRQAPGNTSVDEARYFEGLILANTGKSAAANVIWRKLAANQLTYYGQKAAARLGSEQPQVELLKVCEPRPDSVLQAVTDRLIARRRAPRSERQTATDIVSELLYMQLWDEASVWVERTRRPDAGLAADLGYASGRYHRAIAEGNRLPLSDSKTLPLVYPAGYRDAICQAALTYNVDPMWIHAIIWQESKYNPSAHSGAAARGLMQFIPDTAVAIAPAAGVPDLTLERLYEPQTSVQLGAYYFASLLEEFKHPELALAAYNGGPDNVRRWSDKLNPADPELFVSEIGFIETKRYVQTVFGTRAAYGKLQ